MVLIDGASILTDIGYLDGIQLLDALKERKAKLYSVVIGDVICLTSPLINLNRNPLLNTRVRYFVRTEMLPVGLYIYDRVTDGFSWFRPKVGKNVFRIEGNYRVKEEMKFVLDKFTEVYQEVMDDSSAYGIVKLINQPVGIVINSFPTM